MLSSESYGEEASDPILGDGELAISGDAGEFDFLWAIAVLMEVGLQKLIADGDWRAPVDDNVDGLGFQFSSLEVDCRCILSWHRLQS